MLRVAMIGLGDVAVVHHPAIHENKQAKLVAVCDVNQRLKPEYDEVNFYTDYETMLTEEKLDVVHICLPHHLHLPATKAAVKRGVHVYLEKPIAHTIKEAEALVQLEKDYPYVKICVSLQTRLNETVDALREIAESKQYGDVIGVKGLVTWFRPETYYTEKTWRGIKQYAGGGIVINQGLHTLDLMQLFGGKVTAIKASTSQLLDYEKDVEDTASARIEFEGGAKGLFFATLANSGNSSAELQVIFETAKYTIKDSILTKETDLGKEPVIEDTPLPGTKFYYGPGHIKLINRFYNAILDNTADYIHVHDALLSMQLVEVIYQSSRENRKVML